MTNVIMNSRKFENSRKVFAEDSNFEIDNLFRKTRTDSGLGFKSYSKEKVA